MELAEPVDPAFVLGPIGLGYDRDNDRVLVQLEEVVPVDEEGEPDPEAVEDRGHVRVFLTRGQAAAFCSHTRRRSWPPAGRRAGGAATRSTQTAIHARG